MTLEQVDAEMRYLMRKLGANPVRVFCVYYSVRAFSWFYWYDVADKIRK